MGVLVGKSQETAKLVYSQDDGALQASLLVSTRTLPYQRPLAAGWL